MIETILILLMNDTHDGMYFLHAFRFTPNYQVRDICL